MASPLLSYEEAAAVVESRAEVIRAHARRTERVRLMDAAGRVLAAPLAADADQPEFPRSTRDGFACRAEEAMRFGWMRVAGSTHAGEAPAGPVPAGACWEIMTGAPVPEGADAVVMLEHVEREGENIRLQAGRKLTSGDNVVARGAQARKGDVLLQAGVRVDVPQVALAATCGAAHLEVYRRPRVAILTTGDELVPVEAVPGPGQIRNSNAMMLAALVAKAGGEPWILPSAADTADALDLALRKALTADMVLISGGVSAGKFDLVEPALEKLGAQFHFTGIRIQPGKPLVFGEALPAEDSTGSTARVVPFFGLPGNPISSAVTFLLFASTIVGALAGSVEDGPRFVMAELAEGIEGRGNVGLTRFFPARSEFERPPGKLPQVATVPWQGSGDLAAFGRSNCCVVVPEGTASLEAGAAVRILLF